MIVCICHNLNEAKVRLAVDAGATTACQVHEHYGVRAQCGTCLDFMEECVEVHLETLSKRLAAE